MNPCARPRGSASFSRSRRFGIATPPPLRRRHSGFCVRAGFLVYVIFSELRPSRTEGKMRVPVSIITGFLGSGKTTLLNHLLRSAAGTRLAVIVNEFGAVGVDGALVSGGELFVELDNG